MDIETRKRIEKSLKGYVKPKYYADKDRYGGMLTLNEYKRTTKGTLKGGKELLRPKVVVLEKAKGDMDPGGEYKSYTYIYKGERILLKELSDLTNVGVATISAKAKNASKLDILGYKVDIKVTLPVRFNISRDGEEFRGVDAIEAGNIVGCSPGYIMTASWGKRTIISGNWKLERVENEY